MSHHDHTINGNMPPLSALNMPTQNLRQPFIDKNASSFAPSTATSLFRLATFIPAITITCILMFVFADWFGPQGYIASELVIMTLVGFSSFWISLSVASSVIGLIHECRTNSHETQVPPRPLKVALLVPIYNEDADTVYARIRSMRRQLLRSTSFHNFTFFILSDTQDEQMARKEDELFRQADKSSNKVPVFYRRRDANTERKTGNIRDWVENWGADWDAFITLDADSLMGETALVALADDLAGHPEAGLVQTVPRLIKGNSLFARTQQFANNVYGGVLATGLEQWSGTEGNYWGHNAIIRTKAFTACAGLPKLSGKGALSGTIKSHDFVEAALLRRAGWAIYIRPAIRETFEETPQTLVDYILRDRRWCQGNLQHLRLLTSAGFHSASRFHMLQGAMAYIASVAWFALLIAWTLMGRSESENVFRYFVDANPLFPQWPQMDAISRTFILCFMLAMLLLPKVLGVISHIIKEPDCLRFGGRWKFALSTLIEIILSVAIAPIMMVQHVLSVLRTAVGKDTGWAPQSREGRQSNWFELLRFHALESIMGTMLITGISVGVVSLWLLPIAVSLVAAVPLSWIMSKPLSHRGPLRNFIATAQMMAPPTIITDMSNQAPQGLVVADSGKATGQMVQPA